MTKPNVTSNSTFNINDLGSSRRFEELMHCIFEKRTKDDLKNEFDSSHLMTGVGEKGFDILLASKSKRHGAVQCKMNSSASIGIEIIAKELIKFSLFYYLDSSLIKDLKTFKYYFACSGKFSSFGIRFITNFNQEITSHPNFEKWATEVIKSYKTFSGLTFIQVKSNLENTLTKINITPINYSEINSWLHKYPDVANEFFSIKTVIDTSSFSKGISDIIDVLNPDLESKIKPFLSLYYKSAETHLNIVKFIGHATSYNRPRNITVSNLYIEHNLQLKSNGKLTGNNSDLSSKKIKIHNVLARPKNHIILGDPGAGKSLMVKNIILNLIKQTKRIGGYKTYENHIPFRIELRKYAEEKQKNNINILTYLTSILETEYQLTIVDFNLVSYLVQNRPTLFIFDGLDEIFDITLKSNICDDIVNFISVNYKSRCIVTSRFIGYQDFSFPEKLFEEFSVQGFDDNQIEKFIEKFYKTQIINKTERIKEIQSCKKQIYLVDDQLKSNPLILSLMSLLAINKVVIPDSKLEVYRSCTNTLVETRDKDEKQLKIHLRVKNKRATFGKLAFWQYCQMTDKGKISRILALKSISEYLLETGFDNTIEADEVAEEFLKYAEDRSIYFDDNFMHKTFLEYYTADYIFTRFHNGLIHASRDKIIKTYIANDAWHTVFELLVSMIDELLVETKVMDDLLSDHINSSNHKILFFLLTILKSTKNISSESQYKIVNNALSAILKNDFERGSKSEKWRENKLFNLFKSSFKLPHLSIVFTNVLNDREKNLDTIDSQVDFYVFCYELNNHTLKIDNKDLFTINNKEKLEELRTKDPLLFTHYHLSPNENIDYSKVIIDKIQIFGLNSVLGGHQFRFAKTIRWVSLLAVYLKRIHNMPLIKIQEDLSIFETLDLDISTIKKFISNSSDLSWDHFRNDESIIEGLVILLEENQNKKVDDFLLILLKNFNKKTLDQFMKKSPNNMKLNALTDQL